MKSLIAAIAIVSVTAVVALAQGRILLLISPLAVVTGSVLLEDGTSNLLLEDGSSFLCLEGGC